MVKISTGNGKDLGKKMKINSLTLNLTENMGPNPAKQSGKPPFKAAKRVSPGKTATTSIAKKLFGV